MDYKKHMKKTFAEFLQFLIDDVRYNNAECILDLESGAVDSLKSLLEHNFENNQLFGAKNLDEAVPDKQKQDIVLQYLRFAFLLDFYNSDARDTQPYWFDYWNTVLNKKDSDFEDYVNYPKNKKPK